MKYACNFISFDSRSFLSGLIQIIFQSCHVLLTPFSAILIASISEQLGKIKCRIIIKRQFKLRRINDFLYEITVHFFTNNNKTMHMYYIDDVDFVS